MKLSTFIYVLAIFLGLNSFAQKKTFAIHTIAFYNLENAFDTIKSPKTFDEEFTPNGKRHWNSQKYNKKIALLSHAISKIGTDENPNAPTILGVCEVENRNVLEDIVKHPDLIDYRYGIVHFDSPDNRGIDVALLYQKNHFQPTSYINKPLFIYDKTENAQQNNGKGKRIYTRDQLLVTGNLDGEEVHFIVNHWPSRWGGEKKSSPNREAAALLNKQIIDSLYLINQDAKIITMGDLNDGPYNKSVKDVLKAKGKRKEVHKKELFNPMWQLSKDGFGTLAYRDAWDLFDQMIISEPYLRKNFSSWRYWKARVFKKSFLVQPSGQYKGYPLRNQLSGQPGYSDHFPVYLYLVREQEKL